MKNGLKLIKIYYIQYMALRVRVRVRVRVATRAKRAERPKDELALN
jgi:hypothetical protein